MASIQREGEPHIHIRVEERNVDAVNPRKIVMIDSMRAARMRRCGRRVAIYKKVGRLNAARTEYSYSGLAGE